MTEGIEKKLSSAYSLDASRRVSVSYIPREGENSAYLYFKRTMDAVFSAVALTALMPLMLIVALLIRVDSEGPALFRQKRVGRYGRVFNCLKFRTMTLAAPQYCSTEHLTHPEAYITRIGRILRKTSLDELPQLINILRGDMSIIGPRPLIPDETKMHRMRMESGVYELLPGLTGWAQVNGRDFITDTDKAKLDSYYAKNVSFDLDMLIFARTVLRVASCKDINEGGRN